MSREYYIHKRRNGIFYVEFINPENGRKLSARSTGETDKICGWYPPSRVWG